MYPLNPNDASNIRHSSSPPRKSFVIRMQLPTADNLSFVAPHVVVPWDLLLPPFLKKEESEHK